MLTRGQKAEGRGQKVSWRPAPDWLWSLNGPERRYAQPSYQLPRHTTEVKFLLFSPDSRTLFNGSVDGPIRRWDVEDGVSQGLLAGGILPAAGMALSPDGRTLATINWDQALRLIDRKSGECFAVRKTAEVGSHGIAFAPDGKCWPTAGMILHFICGDGAVRKHLCLCTDILARS